jgi:hypothetical protein
VIRKLIPVASLKVYAHSRTEKRMDAQAKMIDPMGLNEETVHRFIH